LSPRRFTQSFKPLASSDNRMNPPNILEQLRGFDRASPQFHEHISNFLRSDGYRSAVPSLQGEDLAWLVEYLDSVSLYTVSLSSEPKTVVGSHVRVKSCEPRVPGILARTERYLRHQGSSTEIAYAFKSPPGHQPPTSFRIRTRGDFEGTDSACKNAPQRRSADIQDGVFLMTLSPTFRC